MYYEIATLTLPFGTAGKAAQAVQAYCADTAAQGQLLGCWSADIGALNQLLVLRGFATRDALFDERQRTQRSASPFGCGEFMQAMDLVSYQGFDFLPPVTPGTLGPVYEVRTYGIKTGGVQPTLDAWAQALPARHALSPCIVAMVALDGPLRFTNIWAYPTLEARSQARNGAVAQGIWPPKGGPDWLTTDMRSTIVLPTPVSPLK